MLTKYRTAVILCGGKGSRLGETGKKMPKTLIQIHKKPILWYIINELIYNGDFNHFILPVGHKGEMIKNFIEKNFNTKKYKNIKFDIINTGLNTNISNRIFKISNRILSNSFLLLNGDAIFSFKLKNFFINHLKKNMDLTMLTCSVVSPFGVIITKNFKPINFRRNMNYDSIHNSQRKIFGEIYTGMSIIQLSLLREIKFKNYDNFEMNFYPKILKLKNKFKCDFKRIKGFWYAMDDLKQVELANRSLNKSLTSNKINKIKSNLNDK